MKKFLTIALLCAATEMANAAAYVGGQVGQSFLIDGSTNLTMIGASNTPVNVVYASTTNFYNLPGVANNTNLWPAMPLVPMLNTKPISAFGVNRSFAMTGASTGQIIDTYAVSPDATHWYSNFAVIAMAANGTTVVQYSTNIPALGWPFIALQSTWNTNATQHVTNNIFQSVGKPVSP